MPTTTVILLTLLLATNPVASTSPCPPPNANDNVACNPTHRSAASITACITDARTTETCADHATGITRARYLVRAASEYGKAALATGRRTARARQWLAHATILDERVQDDPTAPLTLRKQAKKDEERARAALQS